jgi:Peptidase family M23
MLFTRFLIISVLFFNVLTINEKDKSLFISPLKIPLLLSANFGETRIDHYHSGMDIRTQSVTGKEVVAAADGFIYRIGVSPGGYGNSIFIRHPSGYSTIYGHLERFAPEIEEYVKTWQYENKSFQAALWPSREKFQVKQGQLIAYSGNSGASGGPHLHFEIRKSENEVPVNPLLFNFEIRDRIAPVIEKLAIYPINKHTLINNENRVKKIKVTGEAGKYYLPDENEINISGLAGFGIKSFDMLDDSNFKCEVYSIELKIDSIPIFRYVMDAFSFDESRYVNSHIDYETYMRENIYFERTFVLPNDKLSLYKDLVNRGIFNFNKNKIYHAQIIVTDAYNNISTLYFNIKSQSPNLQNVTKPLPEDVKVMPFNRSNKFSTENFYMNIPSGALYDTLNFSYRDTPGTKEMLSDLHHVHTVYTPLQKACTISIKPDKVLIGKEAKMLIVKLGDDNQKSTIMSKWTNGYLTADIMSFGKYFIGADSVAPEVSPYGFVPGEILSGKRELKINISDEYSGIKSYEPVIDGKWALFEYDQKNSILIYKFDEQRISKGTKHNLVLKVADNVDNISTYKCDFIW